MTDPLVEVVASHAQDGADAALASVQAAIARQEEEIDPLEHALATVETDLARFEERLTAQIVTLPAERLPGTLFDVERLYGALKRLRAVCEAACDARWDAAVPLGGAWKGPDGEFYVFRAPRKRGTADEDGLRADLIEAAREAGDTAALELIGEAFPVKRGFRLTQLDMLAERSPAYAALVKEYVAWESGGPPHLTIVDESGRSKRK